MSKSKQNKKTIKNLTMSAIVTNDANGYNVIVGDPDFNDAVNNLQVNEAQVTMFTQDNGGANISQIAVQPTLISLTRKGITKPIAAISDGDNYPDDAAAAASGIPIGELYHTDGVVKIRLT